MEICMRCKIQKWDFKKILWLRMLMVINFEEINSKLVILINVLVENFSYLL